MSKRVMALAVSSKTVNKQKNTSDSQLVSRNIARCSGSNNKQCIAQKYDQMIHRLEGIILSNYTLNIYFINVLRFIEYSYLIGQLKIMDDRYGSCVPTEIRVEQMRLIRNLIEVKVSENELSRANFTDGITIQVKSEKPFVVNAYWIVKITDIHMEIEKDWKIMLRELTENKFLNRSVPIRSGSDMSPLSSLYQNERKTFYETQKQVQCEIKPPCEIDTSSMTQTPRDFYPLVIIVTCDDEDPSPLATDAAANIHIIHIKDSIVPIRSHVIKQYIKQIDGRILDISQLYQEESAACFICFEEADPVEKLKLFCLLPCRHSPICSNCILRIRECPKCRCPIASVFDINSPSIETPVHQSEAADDRPTIDPNLRHLYDDADDRAGTNRSRREQKSGFISTIKSLIGI